MVAADAANAACWPAAAAPAAAVAAAAATRAPDAAACVAVAAGAAASAAGAAVTAVADGADAAAAGTTCGGSDAAAPEQTIFHQGRLCYPDIQNCGQHLTADSIIVYMNLQASAGRPFSYMANGTQHVIRTWN